MPTFKITQRDPPVRAGRAFSLGMTRTLQTLNRTTKSTMFLNNAP